MEAGGAADEVPVVAAVVVRSGRVLLASRPPAKRHGGRWEFPGGKRRPHEGDEEALRRELREELRVELTRVGRLLHSSRDPGSPYVVRFLEVEVRGEPEPVEHEAIRWCGADALQALPLAPADRDFVRRGLLPALRELRVEASGGEGKDPRG